jgi:hypothetical protein
MKIDLASTKLAFFLIGLLVALMIVSAIIPQKDLAEEQLFDWKDTLGEAYAVIDWLGLDSVYSTPFFFILIALLAVNLLLGNIRRFRTLYRIEKTLFRLRYIGSIVFHLSLLTVMAGINGNYLLRYDGVLAPTEGQTVTDRAEDYLREFKGPLYSSDSNRFTLTLENLTINPKPDGFSADTAQVTISSDGEDARRVDLATGKPLVWEDIEFHYGHQTGYSPELLVADSTGKTLFRSFVRVAARREDGRLIHEDFIDIPSADITVMFSFDPSEDGTLSPSCRLAVTRGSETLLDSALISGETASADGLQFSVPRIRRWCYINAVQSPFLWLVFVGFWASLGGLALTLLARLSRKGVS